MVEIIPKPIRKVPVWQMALFYFSVFLLIATIVSYFVLSLQERGTESRLQELERILVESKTSEMIALEKEILTYRRKINAFAPLLAEHILNSKFFDLIESRTHPRVYFSQVNISSREVKVVLAGKTDSFLTLGQQLLIFEEEPLIEEVYLSQVSIDKEGDINFGLSFVFNPEVFRYSLETQ